MNAGAFDTHAAVKTLREAGADEAMAEAIVNTASAAAGAGHDELATKADLRTAIEPLATKAELRSLQWVVGIQSAITVATFAIVAAKLL